MKRLITLLCALVLAACGSTYNTYYLNPDSGTANMAPDAGDTVDPVITLDVLNAFTTDTSARIKFETSEDMFLNYRLDGPKGQEGFGRNMSAKVIEYDIFNDLDCNTPYSVVAWGTDKAGNPAWQVEVDFKTNACQPTVSLSFSNATSIAAGATITVGNTAEEGICKIYGRNGDGSSWNYATITCVPGTNYYPVNSWAKGTTTTFYVVFQNSFGTAKSADASFTTKNAYEITLSFNSWETDGFDVKWVAQKSYLDVTTWCRLDGTSQAWSMDDQTGVMSYTVRFSTLGPGTYLCHTQGYLQWHTSWIAEASDYLQVVIQPPQPVAGSLRVTTLATPVAQSYVNGTVGAMLANIELNAGVVNSSENDRVPKLVVRATATNGAAVTDIGNLVMYDSNGNALATTANTAVGAAANMFIFATPITVPKTGILILTLKGDVLNVTAEGETITYSVVFANDVTVVGADTGDAIVPTLGVGNGQPMTLSNAGRLILSLVSGNGVGPTADQMVDVGTVGLPVLGSKWIALNEPMKLYELTTEACGLLRNTNDLHNLGVFQDNSTVPFATASQMTLTTINDQSCLTYTWTATDNLLPAPVMPSTSTNIYVKVDIGSAGQAYLGDNFRFKMTAKVKGANSSITSVASGTPEAIGTTWIDPFNVSISGDPSFTGGTSNVSVGTSIARFKVTDNGSAKINLTNSKYTDNGFHNGTETCSLKNSDENSTNYSVNTAVATGDCSEYSGFSIPIDGGAWRILSLHLATLSGAMSGDSRQYSIAKIGDVSYCVSGLDLGYAPRGDGVLNATVCGIPTDGRPSLPPVIK